MKIKTPHDDALIVSNHPGSDDIYNRIGTLGLWSLQSLAP